MLKIFSAHISLYDLIQIMIVGGIFHEDNYESEIAFRYSIERVNMHEKNVELVPSIHHVSTTDSFKAERIGD